MDFSLTRIERAFQLAASGKVSSVAEIRLVLKAEGYPEDRQLHGRAVTTQLVKTIAKARGALSDAEQGKP